MAGESSKCHSLESILQDRKAGPCDLPLQLLKDITNDFSDERELGRGGFGVVYKGVFDNEETVAVKKFHSFILPEVKDRKFRNEVHYLMMLKHENIIRILGYCSDDTQGQYEFEGKLFLVEKQDRLLCLEYMENGSLETRISDESCGLDWHDRYKIIKGICYGLYYLHEGSQKGAPIIHLDLKPANILLTNEMVPKITDFGQSRLFDGQQSRTITKNMVGSLGYMAREYVDHGIITKKSDIFSLGVIIVEIITGLKYYPESAGTSTQDFVENVLEKWRKRLNELRCTSQEKDCQQIKICIEIGLNCVQIDATKRPTSKEIITSLNRWDSTNLQVINEEKSPAEQVDPRRSVPVENVPSRQNVPAKEPSPYIYPPSGFRTCAGCQNPIGHGRFLSCMGSVWHPQCFRCFACNMPISEYEFAMHEDQPYHRSCYKEFFHPKCDICNNFIPTNREGLIEYRAHPFWMQKYCPSHEDDGTPRCCSCERMKPMETNYKGLGDGRELCIECFSSAVMDIPGMQQLYKETQEYFERLDMKVEQQVPLHLVEWHALNKAPEAERSGRHLPETRGVCLSQEKRGIRILRRPVVPGNRIRDMIAELFKLSRQCDVTGIHILYGLPRLQTGSILAFLTMQAYLRLKGYRDLSRKVDNGIGQVLSYMWLESKIVSGSSGDAESSSAAAGATLASSNKDAMAEFEKKLAEFIKYQIANEASETYRDGFRDGYRAVKSYGLRSTLDHIKRTGSFPP